MKVTDLSHLIHSSMPVFPGTEQPIFQRANTLENDGFLEAKITMYSHTGTHIDAPAHMHLNGPYLDEFAIDKFIGTAIILDFSRSNTQVLDIESIISHEETIQTIDFLILKTGWSKYWGNPKYYKGFPYLTEKSAKWLSQFALKGIGIDAISIDDIESSSFPVHKILLEKNIIIIENLTNLDSIDTKGSFLLSVMPLKTKLADGSPVRAIAIEL
ncbi:cyclase family protein [Desulfosporosinus meridiei]|uniref:Putative metal-dependent hydrolase n=1 Tax=Desulfosporosinus meridiei (strain ATCC BAA-275 / DSM 13257 / KCTC 12902 / NCIMB 13706 / S10) TaxID=768704 RepID=J7IVV1_DESMD|nr:cyclase family protein [Desulfosporosinus meridiei]AFQ42811.1 putative metal-dependent hydrolase [Desulfosporosinus meridiei DSM 13257]